MCCLWALPRAAEWPDERIAARTPAPERPCPAGHTLPYALPPDCEPMQASLRQPGPRNAQRQNRVSTSLRSGDSFQEGGRAAAAHHSDVTLEHL